MKAPGGFTVVVVLLMGVLMSVNGTAQQLRKPSPLGPHPTEGKPLVDKSRAVDEAGGAAGSSSESVRIRKLIGAGRMVLEQTPEYKSNVARSAKPPSDWAQVVAVFDTAPDWIDELVFQFHVMTLKVEEGKKSYSLFRATVKCVDVEKGREHLCGVYLRPSTLKRYGAVVASAVEISVGGRVLVDKTEIDPEQRTSFPEKWWTKPEVTESKSVTVRDGYLLERSQTPFAFINVDDFEVSK